MKTGISTGNRHLMPSISDFVRISRAAAMLDAILCPEPEMRYFSCDKNWAPGTVMMSMRSGSGDEYFAIVSSAGAIIKGFAHDSPMSPWNAPSGDVWPGVLDGVPDAFASFIAEPAFMAEDTTFCLWNTGNESSAQWECGNILVSLDGPPSPDNDPNDGSRQLLWIFDGQPETYRKYAANYFEVDAPLDVIRRIYLLEPLTPQLVSALNAETSFDDLRTDIAEIGYPLR